MRVKVSYTVNGFNKFVVGQLLEKTDSFYRVKSELDGAIVKVPVKNEDEYIEYDGGEYNGANKKEK